MVCPVITTTTWLETDHSLTLMQNQRIGFNIWVISVLRHANWTNFEEKWAIRPKESKAMKLWITVYIHHLYFLNESAFWNQMIFPLPFFLLTVRELTALHITSNKLIRVMPLDTDTHNVVVHTKLTIDWVFLILLAVFAISPNQL